MSDDDDKEGQFIARANDPGTSWAGANMASKSQLNALYHQQLFEAGKHGKTTMAMSRDTGRDRDSFSPRYSQNKKTVAWIGKRMEPNKNGKLAPFNVYCLKEFLEETHDGSTPSAIPPGDQGPMGMGLDEPGVAEGVPAEVPIPHD